MRTCAQIREWLRSRDWYGHFIEEMYACRSRQSAYTKNILNGDFGAYTMLVAFSYVNCKYGAAFWEPKIREFNKFWESL